MINVLTVDLEDYYQVSAFEPRARFNDWDKFESRIVDSTFKILDILAEKNVKATFFVLGWLGENYPALIKEIKKQGHEIASHGYNHKLIYNQSPEEFRLDVSKSKQILERIINEKVLGYRAATYSITKKTFWALDILTEEGFRYDSTIFPIYHDRGGIPNARRYPYRIENSNGGILEFPLSTVKILGQNIPFAGGGYFRFFPYGFIKWGINQINKKGYPAIIFIHPWELDPDQPRIKTDALTRFRHYLNLDKTEAKLKRLLNDFEFVPVREKLGLFGLEASKV